MTEDVSTVALAETQPPEPEVPAAEPVLPAPASESPAPPSASGPATPYRTAITAPEALAPRALPRRSSLVGSALFVSGVLLWTFVVMGELTTSYAPGKHGMLVGEALAVVFVLATSAAAWGVALRRSLAVSPASSDALAYFRGASLALLAILLWFVVLFIATALGKGASKNLDGPISTLLLIVSVASALGGRRLAGLHGPASTSRQRLLRRLLWAGSSLLTFVAVVEILGS
jgi:hypothetical protein